MRENELEVLNQYDIDVRNTKKIRDAIWCDTNTGPMVLKEMRISEKRIPVLSKLYDHLQEENVSNVDWIQRNKEGGLFVTSDEGTKYFLKRWFVGKECDIHKESDVLESVRNLAVLHKALENPFANDEAMDFFVGEDVRKEYFRHNREMKKVRTYIRGRVVKGEFEQAFLKEFDGMYEWAKVALERLESSMYESLLQESHTAHTVIHGDYNYHNILFLTDGIATTNFEHFREDIPLTDFYYFLRKVMEKNHWNERLGEKMIVAYQKDHPLTDAETEYLAICIAYPEKFWKVANSYYRSKKSWIPAKNMEKLELVIRQTEEKKNFLRSLFSFHL